MKRVVLAGDNDDPLTDIDVVVDGSTASDPSITGITTPGEPTPAMLEASLPADDEPSTLEPSVGVRGLAGAAAPANDEEEESTTLNVESRLRKALDPPGASPRTHRPATSTAPRPKISKSLTIKGLGSMSDPILTPSEPFRVTASPAISLSTSKARAPMATEPMFDISGSVTNEIAAKEDKDEDTALDAGRLVGGESAAAVAAAASSDKEEDDDVPTSIRHEQAAILPSSDLSTDPGVLPKLAPKHAMAMMPTEPAPFPISSHQVAAAAQPLPPATPLATPAESERRPANRQGPTLLVRRKKRPPWPIITVLAVLAAVTALGVLVIVERETIMSAIGGRAEPAPSASQSSAGAAGALTSPAATTSDEPSEPAAGGTASASASSAADPGKSRTAPVRKPPPPPPARPGPGKPPSSPAPKGSTPLHI